jgi:hypothetical protein
LKKFFIVLYSFLFFLVSAGVGMATVFTYNPTPADMYDLSHTYNYIWTVDISDAVEAGELGGAKLVFKNIQNWTEEENRLFVHLLDGNDAPGVVQQQDQWFPNYVISDEFEGQGHYLFDESFSISPVDFVYRFNSADLMALSSYAVDGLIAFGLDPDCHFYNDGISFSVPEPGLALLLCPAMLGLAYFRRKVIG